MMKVSRPVETGVRREYATDQKWLHTTPKTIVERNRFDRLQKGWSAATLAQKAGLAPRKIKYHEERNTKDEALPLTYAKACGNALWGEAEHSLTAYLRWAEQEGRLALADYMRRHKWTRVQTQRELGVGEYALSRWLDGQSRIPESVYRKIRKG